MKLWQVSLRNYFLDTARKANFTTVDIEHVPSKRSQKKAAVRAMQQDKLADELANDIGDIFIAKGTVLGGPPVEYVEAGSIMQVETAA